MLFLESSASINAAIYIIQTLYLCDVDVKLEAVRQVRFLHTMTSLILFLVVDL